MANWSNPQLTSTYTNFVTEVKDRDVDLALQFDGTTSTNLPTGTIRWSSSANRWQKWSGSSWGELTNTYQLPNITISGVTNAGTLIAGTADITAEITCGRVDVDSNSVAVNGMYLPSTNTLGFATGSTPHYYIDSSGNLLYGRSTARTDVSGRLQLEGTGSTSANILLARNQNVFAATATLNFVKNHAASTTNTALPALSYLGQIGFWGANGTSYVRGVTIYAYADGAWSGSANPTGINIDTTGGGRISLGSTGNFTLFNFGTNNTPVNLNGSAPNNALVLDASGNVNIDSGTFYVDAVNNLVGIGTTGPSYALHVLSSSTSSVKFGASSAIDTQALIGNSAGDLIIRTTSSGDSIIASDTGKYLAFGTNGVSEKMRLDASGNVNIDSGTFYVDAVNNRVGIGTIGPSSLLSLGSTTGTSVDVPFARNANSIAQRGVVSTYTGAGAGNAGTAYAFYSNIGLGASETNRDVRGFFANFTGGGAATGCTNYAFRGDFTANTGTTTYGIYLTGEGKNYFSGNVGIGNNNPTAKVDIGSYTPTAPSLSSNSGASFSVTGTDNIQLNIGSNPSSPYNGWIQMRDTLPNVARPLALNPLGGGVLVGTSSVTANGGVLQISNGITFPATQSACSDANTLDDYEEGTFTPTYTSTSGSAGSATYTSNGKYTKIGNVVTVWGDVTFTNKGSWTGFVVLGGLPFTSASGRQYLGACWFEKTTIAAQTFYQSRIGPSETNLVFAKIANGGVADYLDVASINNDTILRFTTTYAV